MATPSQLVRYFRDCYEADNRETGIANLFAKKYRHLLFLSGTDDLLSGLQDRTPIDREKAVAAKKEAGLYMKDRTLIYGAFPLVGPAPEGGRLPANLCAPLVFFPAEIVDEGSSAFLSVDLTQQRVNFPVLAALAGEGEAARALIEDLLGHLPHAPFRKEDIHAMISLLTDSLPQVEALALAQYPKLHTGRQVRQAMKAAGKGPGKAIECLSACALALIPNSPQTRGVLFELAEMADGRRLSTPVRLLMQEPQVESSKAKKATGRVPAVLSHPQQKVLDSAFSVPLTLVVGPPGTGKSYTIAALALDHLSRGESVLIASRMSHAVDVVARKIQQMIGPTPCVIRGGRRQYLRELKQFLKQMLHSMGMSWSARSADEWAVDVRDLERELAQCDRTLKNLERTLQRQGSREKQWGSVAAGPEPQGIFGRLLRPWQQKFLDWRLDKAEPLWELTAQYQAALQRRSRLITKLLNAVVAHRIQTMLRDHRRELKKFSQAIRARTDLKQERLFSEISLDVLFGTFPIWLVTMADVSEVLPLKPDLFDLVIIDEATQCDIASCLPVLQRARRAVVVGDPNQLRHVSFLAGRRQEVIAERNELTRDQQDLFRFREKSILDLMSDTISTQQQVLFLDEHFRSMPQIISFSNREFYAGALKVMTQRPETVDLPCVQIHHVEAGKKVRGQNDVEARALVDEVVARIEAEESMPAEVCHSLGILSPFRDQVDHLSSMLQKRVSLRAMEKHDLMVGTAHTFQGEERDVMYLSLVVDPQAHWASFRFLSDPNIFNVAITRARNEQVVFCSVTPDDVEGDTLLRRYLTSVAAGPRPRAAGRAPLPDRLLDEVRSALEKDGYRTWPAYPVAAVEIDLVIERGGKTLGIDLIGYPGQFAAVLDIERYRMFQRAGLALFPLPYRVWRRNQPKCIEAIHRWHNS